LSSAAQASSTAFDEAWRASSPSSSAAATVLSTKALAAGFDTETRTGSGPSELAVPRVA
jgi:hypothetical protein